MTEATPIPFDDLAGIFDDQRALPPDALSALYHVFLDAASGGPLRIVEPGAGTGRIAIAALAAGHHVTAIDISRSMLDVLASRTVALEKLAERCTLLTADAAFLPFEDGTFDLGVLAQVLYLIPDWESALDELFRVVRPGGEVMLVHERSEMEPSLRERDAAWRRVIEAEGYHHMPQHPGDAEAVAALRQRAGSVGEQCIARWTFGQSVAEANGALARLRPLYPALDDASWARATDRFRRWCRASQPEAGDWLGGTVELVLVRGEVPGDQR